MKSWIMKLFGRSPSGPMDCHQVGALLQHYLDGHVDDDRARRIEEHLEDCRRCGLELETYERIKSTLAAHRPEVSPESVERLREFGQRLARGEEPPGR
jgi:anti-sigma factor RsiW